jgi:hypothetical protein
MSFLAWIDFGQSDCDRTDRIMDLFSEEDSRDELGIGVVRDALSDLLFPGTSTIQTRLRYMLFVPWIYRIASRETGSAASRAGLARTHEIALIDALERGGETVGVIGSVARGALKRLPSDVYWAGLGTLGIRRFHGTRTAYFELPAGEEAAGRRWATGLPEPDRTFLDTTHFRLTRDEADFVTDRLHDAAPTSLFRKLARAPRPAERKTIWNHPLKPEWSPENQMLVDHAERFSGLLHGAALLYNLLLSERAAALAGEASAWEARREAYRARLLQWQAEFRTLSFADWSLDDLWRRCDATISRVQPRTRRFVAEWLERARTLGVSVADDAGTRHLVEQRERTLKRGKSRFHNAAALPAGEGRPGPSP